MKRDIRNVAASVRQRLANRARAAGEDFGLLLRRYFFERFLYRLGTSDASGRFVLKGAMLLQLWADQPYRSTIDLDLLRRGTADEAALRRDLREVLTTAVIPDDGVRFDAGTMTIEPIRIEDQYGGLRVHFNAVLGTARNRLQVDIGVGYSAWPPPKRTEYPVLLDSPAPKILTYAKETVIAEKLEAMVLLGLKNSRVKDFFDVHYLAATFPFDGAVVIEAIRRTFLRRKTPIPAEVPVPLTTEFWLDSARETQLRAFARRARLDVSGATAKAMIPLLREFLWPPLEKLSRKEVFQGSWTPRGPWQRHS